MQFLCANQLGKSIAKATGTKRPKYTYPLVLPSSIGRVFKGPLAINRRIIGPCESFRAEAKIFSGL